MLHESEHIVATFIEEDVEYRLEDDFQPILDYLRENDLMDSVIFDAVDWLRGWYDDTASDEVHYALWHALEKTIGKEKLHELQDID